MLAWLPVRESDVAAGATVGTGGLVGGTGGVGSKTGSLAGAVGAPMSRGSLTCAVVEHAAAKTATTAIKLNASSCPCLRGVMRLGTASGEPEAGASVGGGTDPLTWKRFEHIDSWQVNRCLITQGVDPQHGATRSYDPIDLGGKQQHVDQEHSIEGVCVEGQRAGVRLCPGREIWRMTQHACGQVGTDQRTNLAVENPCTRTRTRTDFEPMAGQRHIASFQCIENRCCLDRIDMISGPAGRELVKQCRHPLSVFRLPLLAKRHRPSEQPNRMVGPSERFRITSVGVSLEFGEHPSSQASMCPSYAALSTKRFLGA